MWCGSSQRPPPIRTHIVPQNVALTLKRSSEFVVVDQPRASDSCGQHGQRSRALERLRIDDLGVVDPRERPGVEPAPNHLTKLFPPALPPRITPPAPPPTQPPPTP